MARQVEWIETSELPEPVARMARAFSTQVNPLDSSRVLVRYWRKQPPMLVIQIQARLDPAHLAAAERMAGCRIEIDAIAPGYLLLRMYEDLDPSEPIARRFIVDDWPTRFRYRPM